MDLASEWLRKIEIDPSNFVEGQLGKLVKTSWNHDFPPALVIIGCPEYRGAELGNNTELTLIRKHLYNLFPNLFKGSVWDVGDLIPGERLSDTYIALEEILLEIQALGAPIVFLGGSSDLIYPVLGTQEKFEQYYSALAIDYKIDYHPSAEFSNHNYLNRFFQDHPSHLFQYLHAGIQSYRQNPEVLQFFNKVNYDAVRLGHFRQNLKAIEPLFRVSNLAFFDMSSVKISDFPCALNPNPNGFYAEDICQMARYAGLSKGCDFFGFYDFYFDGDERSNKTSAALIAECIWCYLEALPLRINEHPLKNPENYVKFTVSMEEWKQELYFYKSNRTTKWWLQAPRNEQINKAIGPLDFIPCNEEDYLLAQKNIIPETWWVSLFRSN
ncbi:MAG: hypothetical protein ACPF8V_09605 [Luteibaculum sp.]